MTGPDERDRATQSKSHLPFCCLQKIRCVCKYYKRRHSRTLVDITSSLSTIVEGHSRVSFKHCDWPLVYAGFMMMGMASGLPFAFLITAESYWEYKFRDIYIGNTTILQNDTSKTHLQSLYAPLQVVFSLIPNFTFLVLNSIFNDKIPQRLRLIGSISFLIIFFSITATFTQINTDAWQEEFFVINLVLVFLINVAGAIWQGGVFGLAGMFPSKFMTATMTGMGCAGVFAAIARIVSLAVGADPWDAAYIYFVIAVLCMILALISYILLIQMEHFNHYCSYQKIEEIEFEQCDEDNIGVISNYMNVFKKIWKLALTICGLYVVTISVFPVICVMIISSSKNHLWAKKYFQPVITFLLFSVGDLVGRQTAGIWTWPKNNSKMLYIMTCLRVLFIPLFLGCDNEIKSVYSYFHHDSIYIILIILFSISSGHLATLCMRYGPESVSGKEMEKAGAIMATANGLGMLLGGIFSFGFESIP